MTDFAPPSVPSAAGTQGTPVGRTPPKTAAGRRRPHPAAGARVAAAGVGVATMLGLVTTMGLARASDNPVQVTNPTSPITPEIVVVVHSNAVPLDEGATADLPPNSDPADPAPSVSAPVLLTARPEVHVIDPPTAPAAAPSPAATTSGSR